MRFRSHSDIKWILSYNPSALTVQSHVLCSIKNKITSIYHMGKKACLDRTEYYRLWVISVWNVRDTVYPVSDSFDITACGALISRPVFQDPETEVIILARKQRSFPSAILAIIESSACSMHVYDVCVVLLLAFVGRVISRIQELVCSICLVRGTCGLIIIFTLSKLLWKNIVTSCWKTTWHLPSYGPPQSPVLRMTPSGTTLCVTSSKGSVVSMWVLVEEVWPLCEF